MMKTTNLLKRNGRLIDIPIDIMTKPEDVALGLDELIMFMGQRIIVALYDTGYDITAAACERVYDLPFYMAADNKLPQYIDVDSLILLSAIVLDPANLPYDLDDAEEAFVIYDEWDLSRFYSMERVASKVEETFETYNESSIDDFIILAGTELLLAPKLTLIRRLEGWIELNKEVSDGRNILDS
jgi:hypothetical protein